jgi:hypothetical protein
MAARGCGEIEMSIQNQREKFLNAVNDMVNRGETQGMNIDVLISAAWSNACDVPGPMIAEVAIATAQMYCDDHSSWPSDMAA